MKNKIHALRLEQENWHAYDIKKVFKELVSGPAGLKEQEVTHRQSVYGPNILPSKAQPTIWAILLQQILNPLIFILIAAATASFLIGEVTDTIFIMLVIGLNSALGAYQEYNAEKSAAHLQKMLKIDALVKRSGKKIKVPSEEIVPGDLVMLESGSKVPADLRLLETNHLAIDESFLTGESVAVEKNTNLLTENTGLSDRTNMAFAGSTITLGRGSGIVVGTGAQTQVGQIAESVAFTETAKPPLVLRMEKFTKKISLLVLLLSVFLAILLRLQGLEFSNIFFTVVALAVSAIPEGLPVAMTVALSIAATRMARRNVIVRKLTAVESLGSCTVIASDKTGTLTVNQQTAKEIVLPDGQVFTVSGEGYNGEGRVAACDNDSISDSKLGHLHDLAGLSVIANEASLVKSDRGWDHHGDAMDVAFLALAYKMNLVPGKIKNNIRLLSEIPYESERKFSAAFYMKRDTTFVAAKGAVETILDFCTEVNYGSRTGKIDRNCIERQAEKMAGNGLRVLAVCGGICPDFNDRKNEKHHYLKDLVFYGLVGFIDPLRPGAIESVKKCKQAGIKVIMITGDHPSTAGALARQLNLVDHKEPVVTGQQLSEAGSPDSPAFEKMVGSTHMFARVSPTQKLEIVDVLIRQREFVAVTGDGVNDTPALHRANIGVAMGSGTDVAKDVGSMIITDDNFSSIVSGVEEGRFAFDNVRKVIYLLISTGAAEVLLFIASISVGLPIPLLAVQLLWLNLVTNGIQDIALAFEGGEPGAMKRKPRKTSEKIFNPQMISQTLISGLAMGAIAFGLWYWLIKIQMMELTAARNLILFLFVFMQNIHVFNCRSELDSTFKISLSRNHMLVVGVILAQGIHILSLYLPFMQKILYVEPINIVNWIMLLLLAISLLAIMEIFKFVRKKQNSKKNKLQILKKNF